MAPRDDSKDFYQVKRVSFFGRKDVPIICQNENGPCPLLAIANVLLLRNAIALEGSPDRPEVSTAELMSLLAARLLDVNDKSASDDEMVRQNQEQNLNDAVAVLPALATGLDVNVRFRHPLDFEFTAELAVFDLLDVTLCHAWVAGPEHAAARDAIGARSYNQLMERLVELATAEEAEAEAETMTSGEARARSATQTNSPNSPNAPNDERVEHDVDAEDDAALRAALALSLDDADTKTVPSSPTSPTSRVVSAALGEVVAEVAAEASDETGSSSLSREGVEHTQKQKRKQKRRANETETETETETENETDAAVRDARRRERVVLDAFLESSASQLTRAGLRDARDAVKERELAVFFRNNHFATVFKLDGALYLLATDQGYLREPDVVWETLCAAERPKPNAAEEGTFVDAAFAPFAPRADPSAGARRGDEDDARLAAALLASAAETSESRGGNGDRSARGAIPDAIPATFLRAGGEPRATPRRAAPSPAAEPRRMPTTRSPWRFRRSTRRNASAKKPRRARGAPRRQRRLDRLRRLRRGVRARRPPGAARYPRGAKNPPTAATAS
jgi:hypothetical protein